MDEMERTKNKIVELICEMINIPTISGEPEGYRTISALISEEMKKIGLSVDFCESEPGFINVIGRKTGRTNKKRLLFNGHVDVVPTRLEDWLTDPFKARVQDRRIWGRGACDMKGGIAAMILAAERAMATLGNFNGELILTATVDEEIGGFRGLRYLVEQNIMADMAIVCEPTNLQIANVFKGLLWFKLRTKGKEAHGGMTENGINAIYKMAQIIIGLSNFSDPFPTHDILGKPTLNIGTISGGTKPNIVPPLCEIELDMRFLPGQSIEMMLSRVQEVIEKIKLDNPDMSWELSSIMRKRMPIEIKKDEPLIQFIREAAQEVTGEYPVFRGMPSPGDCEHLVKVGIPAVMFGPGNVEALHIANEYIEIDEIIKAVEIYSRIIIDFFS